MLRVALVGLLLAHITGPDPGCVAHPNLVAQPFQQIQKPLAVAARLHAHQRRSRQRTIEPFRLPVPVDQLALFDLTGVAVKNRHLLPPRMKITPYNLHEGFSLEPVAWSSTKS